MLTHAEEINIPHENEIPMINLEYRLVDNLVGILIIALGEELQGFGVALGGFVQALSVWILAHVLQDLPHGRCHAFSAFLFITNVGFLFCWCGVCTDEVCLVNWSFHFREMWYWHTLVSWVMLKRRCSIHPCAYSVMRCLDLLVPCKTYQAPA